MNSIAFWIVPPVVGAVIGYVTNDIAIKMLFRPLAEKRILGVRIPFTPGILPRQRKKLAQNIGSMVSRELLTDAIVRDRLRSPEFRVMLERSVSGYTERLLNLPMSAITGSGSSFPDNSDFSRAVSSLSQKFIESDAFASLIRSIIDRLADYLETHTPVDILCPKSQDVHGSIDSLLARIVPSIFSSENEKKFVNATERITQKLLDEKKKVYEVIPESSAATVERFAEVLYPLIVESGIRFLNEASTRTELEIRGKLFLRDAMTELNAFQRFFISAAQYDKTLNERMPAIIDDLIHQIEELSDDPRSRVRFSLAVSRSFKDFSDLSVDRAAEKLKVDPVDTARLFASRLFASFSKSARNPSQDNFFYTLLREVSSEPLSVILRDRLGVELEPTKERFSTAIISYVRREGPASIPRFVDGVLSEYGEKSVSAILSINPDEKQKFDVFLTDKMLVVMDERISSVLQSLDVRKIVSERIDSLDMLDVERIVLDVLANQLKWINVFGAILGGLIGIIQVSITFFFS